MEISDFLKEVAKGFFKKLDESYFDKAGRKLVKRATCFAIVAHYGQERASGEPFVYHSIAVGELLLEIGRSAEEIAAGVLHDVVEDTKVTLAEIEENFGPEITFLVNGMTKIFESSNIEEIERVLGSQVAFAVREMIGVTAGEFLPLVERDEIYQAKLYVMVEKDHRLVFIRLADRVHNMRTLRFLPVWKQQSVARETLEFHLPLANLFLSPDELALIKPWLRELVSLSRQYSQSDCQKFEAQRSALSCLTAVAI